jgi:hypothetical protein
MTYTPSSINAVISTALILSLESYMGNYIQISYPKNQASLRLKGSNRY